MRYKYNKRAEISLTSVKHVDNCHELIVFFVIVILFCLYSLYNKHQLATSCSSSYIISFQSTSMYAMYARTQAAKRHRSASPASSSHGQRAGTQSPKSVFTEAARSSEDRYRVQPPLAYFSLLFHSTSMYARTPPASPRTTSGQEERKESTNSC